MKMAKITLKIFIFFYMIICKSSNGSEPNTSSVSVLDPKITLFNFNKDDFIIIFLLITVVTGISHNMAFPPMVKAPRT